MYPIGFEASRANWPSASVVGVGVGGIVCPLLFAVVFAGEGVETSHMMMPCASGNFPLDHLDHIVYETRTSSWNRICRNQKLITSDRLNDSFVQSYHLLVGQPFVLVVSGRMVGKSDRRMRTGGDDDWRVGLGRTTSTQVIRPNAPENNSFSVDESRTATVLEDLAEASARNRDDLTVVGQVVVARSVDNFIPLGVEEEDCVGVVGAVFAETTASEKVWGRHLVKEKSFCKYLESVFPLAQVQLLQIKTG